jgi:hypothetical protein
MPSSTSERPDELVQPPDLRLAAQLSGTALRPFLAHDWSERADSLQWTCRQTLFHMCHVMFSYTSYLGGRWQRQTPFRLGSIVERSDGSEASPGTLLHSMQTLASVLADVAQVAPPQTRAYHIAGMADRSGFLAMGCDELMIHTDDILRAFGTSFAPPDELVVRVLARLFPWAPHDTDPWTTLRWSNGRADLPGHPNPGADWLWHCAPLAEWDGSIPRMA